MIYTTRRHMRVCRPPGISGFLSTEEIDEMRRSSSDGPEDVPLGFDEILNLRGLRVALASLANAGEPAFCRKLAFRFAQEVQDLILDLDVLESLKVVGRYLDGLATDGELYFAYRTAWRIAGYTPDPLYSAYAAAGSAAHPDAAKAAVYTADYALRAAFLSETRIAAVDSNSNVNASVHKAKAKVRARQFEIFLELLKEKSP